LAKVAERIIVNSFEEGLILISRPVFTNPVHLDVEPAIGKGETELPGKSGFE
jgi:hypothetical protein